MSDFVLKTSNLSHQYQKGSKLSFQDLLLTDQQHTLVLLGIQVPENQPS